MHKPNGWGVAATWIAVWTLAVVAMATAQHSSSFIPVNEIRPGMRGYGLTVFRGTTPERFDVEVVDVLHHFRPSQDLILIRTPHPILDRALTVAGMSGSPIYLDGKLAGAYAYGWAFGKDPVAGVTPIGNMVAEMRRPLRHPFSSAPRAIANSDARHLASRALWDQHGTHAFDPLEQHISRLGLAHEGRDDTLGFQRVSTPLMVGGLSEAGIRLLGKLLEPFHVVPMQGGGNGVPTATRTSSAFGPGSPIGVDLIRGDISMSGIGTVTYVDGDRLVAFGHPMLDAGEVALPTATARVLHIFLSERVSSKMAETVQPMGTLFQDRQAAIAVDTKHVAETIPVTVRIHGADGAPQTEWRVRVADHRMLTPLATFTAASEAVNVTAGDKTDVVTTVKSRIRLQDRRQWEFEDVAYLPGGPSDAAALARLRTFEAMEAAYLNPFEDVKIAEIQLDIHLRFARDVVQIMGVGIGSDEVDPGQTVHAWITYRRFGNGGRMETRDLPISIPPHVAGQTMEIVVQPGNAVELELPEPRDLNEILANVRAGFPSTSVVMSMQLPSRGLVFKGHVARSLAPSAFDALQFANDSQGGRPITSQERREVPMGGIVIGSARTRVVVRKSPKHE